MLKQLQYANDLIHCFGNWYISRNSLVIISAFSLWSCPLWYCTRKWEYNLIHCFPITSVWVRVTDSFIGTQAIWIGEVIKMEGDRWFQKLLIDLKTLVVIFHWDWRHLSSGRTLGPVKNFLDCFYSDPGKLRVKKCLLFNHFCVKPLLLCCILATGVEVMRFLVDFQAPFLFPHKCSQSIQKNCHWT